MRHPCSWIQERECSVTSSEEFQHKTGHQLTSAWQIKREVEGVRGRRGLRSQVLAGYGCGGCVGRERVSAAQVLQFSLA